MSDLYELLKAKQDQLRGREEDWIDRVFDGWRHTDKKLFVFWVVFMVIAVPHIIVLFAIEFVVIWQMFN